MKIVRRINNNIVQVDDNGVSKIIVGSGLGFKAYPGDHVEPKKVEQTFVLDSSEDTDQFVNMINSISLDMLSISRDIYNLCINGYNLKLSENFVISLADHLQYTIERLKEGITIKNPLEWEVKQYFPIEYKAALGSVMLIENRLSDNFPESEVTAIALHLINAERASNTELTGIELTELISSTKKVIEYVFQVTLDETTISFARFATHLRYYLSRQLKSEQNDPGIDEGLTSIVKKKYSKEYSCAIKITEMMADRYGFDSNSNEVVYLTMHISRLIRENRETKKYEN